MDSLGVKRRAATLHCGFIIAELDAVGAGSEGWIDHPSLFLAMSPRLLALARSTSALIVGWEGEEDETEAPRPVVIHLPGIQEQQQVRAMEWLLFDRFSVLAVGTSQGSLLLYSIKGHLLLKQNFQASPILRLRVRGSPSKISQHNCVEELCIVYPKAIVRIDVTDFQPLLQRCLRENEELIRKGKGAEAEEIEFSSRRLVYQLWNVSKTGGTTICVDGAITGVMPPPLLEHQSSQRYFCAITVGPDCALAAHRLSEDKSNSLTSIIIKKFMPATVSTIASLTRALWRSNDRQASDVRALEVKPQDYARASLITSLKDHPRRGERITLSPSGTLAAVTDSLGRVLLIDTQALIVIRLWKGYRGAHCYFLEAPVDDSTESASQRTDYDHPRKQDLFLCLAIHAPRRGVVEIWKLRNGPRVSVVKCGKGCRILQPATKLRGSKIDSDDEYIPAQVYIFNGDSGHIAILNPYIPSY